MYKNRPDEGVKWVVGRQATEEIGLSDYTLKRLARSGVLVEDVHYRRVGPYQNSKYHWNVEACIKSSRTRSLRAKPQQSF